MIFILVMLLSGNNEIAVYHIEFTTKESCESLQKKLSGSFPGPRGYFECIKK